MNRLLYSRNLWLIAALWGGFWMLAPFLDRTWLFDIMNSLVIAGCVGVFLMYSGSVIKDIHRNDLDGAHYLIMGICGFMLAQAVRYSWNWLWRYFGQPEGMQDHIFVAWLIWVAFTCTCVHLLARGTIAGDIPKENYRWLGIIVAIGIAFAGFVVSFLEP